MFKSILIDILIALGLAYMVKLGILTIHFDKIPYAMYLWHLIGR